MSVVLRDIRFGYGEHVVLDGVTLKVPSGGITGLSAPSGRGKSTLLRVAALLERPQAGSVELDGQRVGGTRFGVAPSVRRRIGLVLQSPRNATNERLSLRRIIAEPLSFAAGHRRPRPELFGERLAELADEVQLTSDLLERLPHQVSDGQLQRACLARALALDPDVLLCDEPTAMLDAPTTAVMMRIVKGRAEAGAAVLMASHDRALLEAVGADVQTL